MNKSSSSWTRPTIAEIDLSALSFNLRSSKQFIGSDVRYMAVVKANAYGHGAVECSRRLESEGIDWLAVALVEEGAELRNAGIAVPILVLGSIWPGQEGAVFRHELTPVVFTIEQATILARAARDRGTTLPIHLKIDTGMGRVGVPVAALSEFLDQLAPLSSLAVDGAMSHFAAADDPASDDFTEQQIIRFETAVALLRARGYNPRFLDLANSPGSVGHPRSRPNMVRLGGILYGLGGDVLPASRPKPELRPVMTLKTRIAQLKHVPAGESIGYGRSFVTRRNSLIATLPIGYNDGYRRALSNRADAIVKGQLARVVGRVSMDWTVLDVTDIPQVTPEDTVTLIGEDGGRQVLAEDLAGLAGTISYEITCGITSRVARSFK